MKSYMTAVIPSIHFRAGSEEQCDRAFVTCASGLVQGTGTVVLIVSLVHVVARKPKPLKRLA